MAGDPKAAQWKSNRSSSGKKTVSSKKISAKDEKKTTASAKKSSIKKPSGTASKKKPLLNSTDETKEVQVDGHALIFKHLSKIYWPKEGFTKRQLLNYYYEASPFILPYLKDRPQSLNRFPNGIGGESFYHKDV